MVFRIILQLLILLWLHTPFSKGIYSLIIFLIACNWWHRLSWDNRYTLYPLHTYTPPHLCIHAAITPTTIRLCNFTAPNMDPLPRIVFLGTELEYMTSKLLVSHILDFWCVNGWCALWCVIIILFPNGVDGCYLPPLKLGHGWIIKRYSFMPLIWHTLHQTDPVSK